MNIQRPVAKLPIPENAKRVFSGVIFDVYHWQQKLFDGSFATYEKVKRKDTVNVIGITREGKFIVTKQEQAGVGKFIGLAGGRVDEDEKIEDAARRELLEETGYQAGEVILWDSMQLAEKIDFAGHIFVARNCVKVADQKLDPGEKIEVELVDFEDFINLPLKSEFRDSEIIMKLLKDGFVRYDINEKRISELRKIFMK